jgi:ubiquinone biosynthesis protein
MIEQLVPIERLVPHEYRRWRPLVRDAIAFVFGHLSEARLSPKLAEQMALPPKTRTETRLGRMIAKMPGIQKVGQVLARNRHLAPSVRKELSKLENGISDVRPAEICASIREQLGPRLKEHQVEVDTAILSEASVSAVVRFTWWNPERAQRERGVFKVLKPYIPEFFAEDMTLLQQLGQFLTAKERGYSFAVRDIGEVLDEVRLLLEHELDFTREQETLLEAARAYRFTFGIRVPRLIKPLCTPGITAMTEENGVKVTDAFRDSPAQRARIAEQLIEGLISVPLFSRLENVVFHADPHAGNLLYDEARRELVILDWALAQPLARGLRRNLAMLVLMMGLRNETAACEALQALSERDGRRDPSQVRVIVRSVEKFFKEIPANRLPTSLEVMRLLDRMALQGVRFPAPLAMFRKVVFTLDGVLYDVAGPGFRMDSVIARDYATRWLGSFGAFLSPLSIRDWIAINTSALKYGARLLTRAAFG